MKLFNSNKVKGKVVLEALVDGRTQALLKTLEMEKLVCEVKYKVLDSDTIALYISIENPIDMENGVMYKMGKDIHTKEIGWMERLAERENIHTYVTIK